MDKAEIDDEESAPTLSLDPSSNEVRRCKFCASPMDPGDQVCSACGTHVTGRYPTFIPSETGPPQPAQTRKAPAWQTILGFILLLVALARVHALLDSNSDDQAATGLHTISGTLLLTKPGAHWEDRCAGSGIVHAGAPVTVLNLQRTPLATAALQGGTAKRSDQCEFVFTLTGVPETDNYYFVVAGERFPVPYPYRFLADELDWNLNVRMTERFVPNSPTPATAATTG